MGWVTIPLAVLGLAALSNGGSSGTEYASYQECSYAPPAYGHQAAPSYGYTQSAQGSGQEQYSYEQSGPYQSIYPAQPQMRGEGSGYYGGYAGGSYTGGGGYGVMAGGAGY